MLSFYFLFVRLTFYRWTVAAYLIAACDVNSVDIYLVKMSFVSGKWYSAHVFCSLSLPWYWMVVEENMEKTEVHCSNDSSLELDLVQCVFMPWPFRNCYLSIPGPMNLSFVRVDNHDSIVEYCFHNDMFGRYRTVKPKIFQNEVDMI